MHDAADTKKPLTPISAPSSDLKRWQPVYIEQGMLTKKGGYSTRGEQAQSIRYQDGDNTYAFVELDKNAQWFLKGVGGRSVRKGDLKPVQAMQFITS